MALGRGEGARDLRQPTPPVATLACGVGFMMLAVSVLPAMNAVAKSLTMDFPVSGAAAPAACESRGTAVTPQAHSGPVAAGPPAAVKNKR